MAGLAAAGAAKSMGAIVRGFDTRYKMGGPHNAADCCNGRGDESDSNWTIL